MDFGGRNGSGSSALCRAAGVGIVSFSFSLACCAARPSVCSVIGVGALEYKAGETLFGTGAYLDTIGLAVGLFSLFGNIPFCFFSLTFLCFILFFAFIFVLFLFLISF